MVALPSQLSLMLGPALHLSIPPIELHCELYQESGSNCKKKKICTFLGQFMFLKLLLNTA